MMQPISRVYNDFNVDEKQGIITKSSSDVKLQDEIHYYKNIPKEYKKYFPKLIGSSAKDDKHHLKLKYIPVGNLGDLMINEAYDEDLWLDIFGEIKSILNDFSKKTVPYTQRYADEMFIKKTENEYNKFKNNKDFINLFRFNTLTINDVDCANFDQIWPVVKDIIRQFTPSDFCVIHGDMCFSNILYNPEDVPRLKLIDPRGSFGAVGHYGDRYYDIAKILHSIDGGYEYFITDNFEVKQSYNIVTLTYGNDNKNYILNTFINEFSDYDLVKAHIIEGLIYIGMCARHYDNPKRQVAMYATGIRILNDVIGYINQPVSVAEDRHII